MQRIFLPIGLALILLSANGLWAQSRQQKEERAGQAEQQMAQYFTGTLVDADCKAVNATKPCEITASTRSYGIQAANGAFAKFDANGNSMVAEQLRGRKGRVSVTVQGTLAGDTLQVQAVQIER